MRLACLASFLACAGLTLASEGGHGESTDIEIGGPGIGPGEFLELRDITFGSGNKLYVLEGRRLDHEKKEWVGNCRVQVFDAAGTYIEKFAIEAPDLAAEKDPSRIAVSADGGVFVTEPASGAVLEFRRGDGWALRRTYAIPRAFAVSPWKVEVEDRIIVLPNAYAQNRYAPFDRLEVIDPRRGERIEPVHLSRGIAGVMDIATDARGYIYALAEVNQLYQFDSTGKLIAGIGGGTWRRAGDGSELRHSVAIDPQGRIYSQAWGQIARFEPDLEAVSLKIGQFYWYDNWSPHDAYTPFAFDADGRFWIGATGTVARGVRHHFRPCLMRAKEDFFKGLAPQSTLALGFDPEVLPRLPLHIAYDLSPIDVDVVIEAAFRQVRDVIAEYNVYDVSKSQIASGSFPLALEDGVESRTAFRFAPPRWGWYTIECAFRAKTGERVRAVGAHVGVTPAYDGVPVL